MTKPDQLVSKKFISFGSDLSGLGICYLKIEFPNFKQRITTNCEIQISNDRSQFEIFNLGFLDLFVIWDLKFRFLKITAG